MTKEYAIVRKTTYCDDNVYRDYDVFTSYDAAEFQDMIERLTLAGTKFQAFKIQPLTIVTTVKAQ